MQAQKAEGTKDLIGRDMRAWQRMQKNRPGNVRAVRFRRH